MWSFRKVVMLNEYDKLINYILNLNPSDIDQIFTSKSDDKTIVYVKLKRRNIKCPLCSSSSLLSKGLYNKRVSLPLNFNDDVFVIVKVPRYICTSCNHTFSDSRNLSPRSSSISFHTIGKVKEFLKEPSMNFKQVASLLHISESSVIRIFDKYCNIPRIPLPEVLCIDEIYTKHTDSNSPYSCVFSDFFNQSVIEVLSSRRKNYLHYYLSRVSNKEKDNVKYVCMDMYKPYKDIVNTYFKKARICVDSFHVIQHLNTSFNKIRIRIMKSYPTDSIEYYLLKTWKNLLLKRDIDLDNKARFNKRLNRYINHRQLQEMLLNIHPDIRCGFALKELYIEANASYSYEDAVEKLDDIIDGFKSSEIAEYEDFVTMYVNWREEIINSFIRYKEKRLSNSTAESINSKIRTVLYVSKGIKNSKRRRNRIIYSINKNL